MDDTGFDFPSNWKYYKEYQGKQDFDDPRLALIRHLQWQRSPTEHTVFSLPEPHNYNRGCFTMEPHECPDIAHQIIYYNPRYRGWVTLLYVVGDDQIDIYKNWLKTVKPLATWSNRKTASLKIRKPFLFNRGYVSDKEITDMERLWSMNLFSGLEGKYNGDYKIILDKYVGKPRDSIQDIINEWKSKQNE